MIESIDITLNWLKHNFPNTNLNQKDLEPAFGFLMLWGIFEKHMELCNNKVNAKGIFDLFIEKHDQINESTIVAIYSYFHKRYVIDKINGPRRFSGLRINEYKLEDQEFIIRTLEDKNCDLKNKLTCSLLIIYRFRNNIYHGNKHPVTINKYSQSFTKINQFLRNYLETILASTA